MVKKAILLFTAAAFLTGGAVKAQLVCGTDEVHARLKAKDPEGVARAEAQLKAEIDAALGKMNLPRFKVTAGDEDTAWKDTKTLMVPVVFHIIHDYGQEYVSDDAVFKAVEEINDMYAHRNSDTSEIIPTYAGNIPGTNIRYATNTNIQFYLPTKDPLGNPTRGITRYRSFTTSSAGDHAKFGTWPRESYLNIWIVRSFDASHTGAAAYAYKPAGANNPITGPYYDGVISTLQNNNLNYDNTLAHEIGHSLNLDHVWGGTNNPEVACGDDDVDDTPPTIGHKPPSSGSINPCYDPLKIYDDSCAVGYEVVYSPAEAKKLFNINTNTAITINYPDTVNSQNVMDYTYCSKMFTYLQGVRMRAALRSEIAGRNNLIDTANLILTGVLNPNGSFATRPDLPPVAEFSLNTNFTCRGASGSNITFKNQSWNDTVSSVQWFFSNGATNPSQTGTGSVSNRFDSTGFVTIKMIATSNTGSDTIVSSNQLYVADENATSIDGYFQEFNPGGDLDKYPIFNHFNNFTKWEVVNNAGYFDNTSIRYKQYDTRNSYPDLLLGTPAGDYDDFYTPAFDLSDLSNNDLYLTFFTSGAFRTVNVSEMNDLLEIAYSSNCGFSWKTIKTLSKTDISNKGVISQEWTPGGFWDWQPQNIKIASSEITTGRNRVYFRFRFKPGSASVYNQIGTGNNFYLDRIHISKWTTDVAPLANINSGIAVAPNPTNKSAFVIIKDAKSNNAQITVTDVTGKLVYRTEANLNGSLSRIEIPANYISVKGMYLVQVTTGSDKYTEKLVVY